MLRSLCLTILSIKVVTINIGFQEIRYDNLEVKSEKNFKFYIKQDKSTLSENTINQELYREKNIEIVTIESNCYKRE